jgi:type I restriction enzyme M protein
VHDKWLAALRAGVQAELGRVSSALTGRVRELAERYEQPLPALEQQAEALQAKVNAHLERMGFAWA